MRFLEYIKAFFSIIFLFIGLGLIIVTINLIIINFRWIYIFNFCIGYVLVRYGFQIPFIFDDDHVLIKEIKRRRKLENEIKINGDLIRVPSNEIFIDEEVEEFIIERATNTYGLLSGLIHGIDRSRDVKDYEISSVLIYKTKIGDINYKFVSLPVNRRKESIFFMISKIGYVNLYVDKTDKEIYYFDVEFLRVK